MFLNILKCCRKTENVAKSLKMLLKHYKCCKKARNITQLVKV